MAQWATFVTWEGQDLLRADDVDAGAYSKGSIEQNTEKIHSYTEVFSPYTS